MSCAASFKMVLIGTLVVLSSAHLSACMGDPPQLDGGTCPRPHHEGPGTVTPPNVPLGFIENRGQLVAEDVEYYARTGTVTVSFSRGAVAMTLAEPVAEGGRPIDGPDGMSHSPGPLHRALAASGPGTATVVYSFDGARDVPPVATGRLPGYLNFLLGDDPVGWTSGVPLRSKVVYLGLYPGIDLVYSIVGGDLKYEFVVHPGGDPGAIKVRLSGHRGLSVEGGDLVVSTDVGSLRDGGLHTFYADGLGEDLGCGFVLMSDRCFGFHVEDVDDSRTLVIDPIVMATYIGSDQSDSSRCVKLDSQGAIYITGETAGAFPVTQSAYQTSRAGGYDVHVTKFAPNGSQLVFSTYIGGTSGDAAYHLDLDGSGDMFVGGVTISSDFPTTKDAFQNTSAGDQSGFVCKLSSDGKSLLYSTYLRSPGYDVVMRVMDHGNGTAIAAGFTTSSSFPTTTGAYMTSYQGGDADGFVCILDPNGTSLERSTYFGGNMEDTIYDLQMDGNRSVYIGGYTDSPLLPTSQGAYKSAFSGDSNGYILKLKPDLGSRVFCTYFGGSKHTAVRGIGLASDGSVYFTGNTNAPDLPTTQGAYQSKLSATDFDLYIARISYDGGFLKASTYLGARGYEKAYGFDLDGDGRPCVGGQATRRFPTTDGTNSSTAYTYDDAFFSKMDGDLARLLYSTLVRGGSDDYCLDIAFVNSSASFMTGSTRSSDLPTTNGSYQGTYAGRKDCFLAKLVFDGVPPVARAGPDIEVDQHRTVRFNGTMSSDNNWVANWTWNFTYGYQEVVLYGAIANFTFDNAGLYRVTLTVSDPDGLSDQDVLNVTVLDTDPPFVDAGGMLEMDQGEQARFDGTNCFDNVGIANWTWTFTYRGERVVLSGEVQYFIFEDAGPYNVTLNVTDEAGNWATDLLRVHVRDTESPVVVTTGEIVVDQYERVSFNASASSDNVGIVSYEWNLFVDDRHIVLSGATATFTFDSAGRFAVQLDVTDAEGNVATVNVVVVVRDVESPVARAGLDRAVDPGTNVHLNASGSSDNVGIDKYSWTFAYRGTNRTLEGVTAWFVFDDAGVFQVRLNVTDAAGNSGYDTITITVPDKIPPVADAGEGVVVAQHTAVTFDGTGSSDNLEVVGYRWTFKEGGKDVALTGPRPEHTFEVAGNYSVTLVVTDAAGNEASDTVSVRVQDTEPPVVTAGGDRTVPQDTWLNLDAAGSTDNVGIVEYLWTFEYGGRDQELTGELASFLFSVPGDYNVTLTALDLRGNRGTTSLWVHVLPKEVPWRLGPFVDGEGTPIGGVSVVVELNGTVYSMKTGRDGYGRAKVSPHDMVSVASIRASKEGWKTLEHHCHLDDDNAPVEPIPPMERLQEGEGGGGMAWWPVALVVVVLALVCLFILFLGRQRPE